MRATSASSLNRPSQRLGCTATINPSVPQTDAIVDRTRPGDLASAVILLRAPIRPDHRDDRCSKAKSDRLHDVFEPRAHRIADGGFGPELAGDARQHHDRQVGNCGVDQTRHANLENIGE